MITHFREINNDDDSNIPDREELEHIIHVLDFEAKNGNFSVEPIDNNIGKAVFIERSEFSTNEVFIIESFDIKNSLATCKQMKGNATCTFKIDQLRSATSYYEEAQKRLAWLIDVKRFFFRHQIIDETLN